MLPGFSEGAMVGAGCRRGTSGAAVRRRHGQDASPISAPRPAARPRSSRRPAPKSPRSTVRRRGWRGCATIWRGFRWRPRPWSPTRWNGRARLMDSTASWSMRPALRPAPSAVIPMSPGCGRRPISPRWPRCRGACCSKAARLLKPGGTLVYCTCSLEPEEGEAGHRGAARRRTGPAPRARSRPGSRGPFRHPHRRGRSAHPALPSAACRPPACGARRLLRRPIG